MSREILIAAGAGPVLNVENAPRLRVDPQEHGVPVTIFEQDVAPGSLGTPHLHEDEDQLAMVMDGTLGFMVGEDEFYAGPGTIVVRPRGLPHALWNATDQPVRMIELSLPGVLLDFYRALDALLAEGRPTTEQLVELAAQYNTRYRFDLVEGLEQRHGVSVSKAVR
jgi:uncharacterized cupin superfamily protein